MLVTSALPYVNNVPHLGNLIGSVLSADVYSRYLRQRSINVIYMCGTDEYGTTTENKAQEEGVTPREICDKYHRLHADVYKWFDIAFDHFGRTSTEKQTEIVQEIFWDVYNNGFIVKDTIEQLYCENDKRFLADRYVRGTCPKCSFEDARGDQCDNCGNLLNPSELIRPACSLCGNTPVTKGTDHLFIDLPKLEKELGQWVEKTEGKNKWSENSVALTKTWLRDGLKSRCITRDLKWGVPVPLEGYEGKVFYVWFDAPIGYLSITAEYTPDWRQWWCNSESDDTNTNGNNVELVQFMGKDNAPFHTILFPSSLIATRKEWTMLQNISTTEYLNYESGKFSKSRNVGVFGDGAEATGIEAEVWRYYLLVNRPEASDTVFTWSDFAAKNNDELLKNTGNFLHRTVTFISSKFDSTLPQLRKEMDETTESHMDKTNVLLKQYHEHFELLSLKQALKTAMAISSVGNSYFQIKQPWNKSNSREDSGNALAFAANIAVLIIILLEPFLGSKFAAKALTQLGLDPSNEKNHLIPDTFTADCFLKAGHKIAREHSPLFTKISTERIKELRNQFAGAQNSSAQANGANTDNETIFPLDLRVGCVKSLEHHPENDSLCVLQVDLGEGKPRTIVAGSLRGTALEKEIVEANVTVVCNMQKVSLGGVESEGMILMGNSSVGKGDNKVKACGLLSIGKDAIAGKVVVPKDLSETNSAGAGVLDRKAFQKASKGLRVGENGCVLWKKESKLGTIGKEGQWIEVNVTGVAAGGKVK